MSNSKRQENAWSEENVRSNIQSIKTWLEEEGIMVPTDFEEECWERATRVGKNEKIVLRKGIKEIKRNDIIIAIRLANFWEPVFMNRKAYEEFVVAAIYGYFRNGAFSVNNNPGCEKLYINNVISGGIKEDVPMAQGACGNVISTSVNLGGTSFRKI